VIWRTGRGLSGISGHPHPRRPLRGRRRRRGRRAASPRGRQGRRFLDGDATPLGIPSFAGAILGTLFINPYKTSVLRLALSQDRLVKDIYAAQCGPLCPRLDEAGVSTCAALTARRIGAPPPVYVPGRHLTMISSPRQVASAIDSLGIR